MPFIPMSFNNTIKTRVVVVRVVAVIGPLQRTPTDNATRAAIGGTRRSNGVFVIIAAPMRRQQPFAVAEYDAVLLIRVRPACGNQVQRIDCFTRQLRHRDGALHLILTVAGCRIVPRKRAGDQAPAQTAKRHGADEHAAAEPLACHESGFPLLDHEFDDHERRKGIANGPWNQRSFGKRKVPMLRRDADCPVFTILDRLFYPKRDKISSTMSSGMSGSGSLYSGRFGGGNTVVSG